MKSTLTVTKMVMVKLMLVKFTHVLLCVKMIGELPTVQVMVMFSVTVHSMVKLRKVLGLVMIS
jgi:hypothetical protein